MFFRSVAVVAAGATLVAAQRPSNTTICDYYTTALLMNNTAANQKTLLTLVVNTAVIGNYTQPNVGIAVPGILAPGTFDGTEVSLAPYFTGALASTNTGGTAGRSVNFLDGGGAAPLMENKPSNDTNSNQEKLLTHLYEYFGALLGCSMMGNDAFPAYSGSPSQYNVHKFMDLSAAEVGYFIGQVAMSAASFGVAEDDLTVVGNALNSLFNVRCAPETVVVPTQPARLQSICIDETCALSPNATCESYNATMKPENATATSGSGSSPSGSASPTSSGPVVATANSAAIVGGSFFAVAGGLAAVFL